MVEISDMALFSTFLSGFVENRDQMLLLANDEAGSDEGEASYQVCLSRKKVFMSHVLAECLNSYVNMFRSASFLKIKASSFQADVAAMMIFIKDGQLSTYWRSCDKTC